MSNSKKEKFNQKSKSNSNLVFIVGAIVVFVIIAAAGVIFTGQNSGTTPSNGQAAPTAQAGAQITEVNINTTISGNKVVIKKSEVEQNKIVRFEYEPVKLTLKNGQQISFPLMAYITPSGKLNVAIRMCEPCNGLKFSTINGNILNCDTCGTQWDLETNQWNGVGAQNCGSYPPEIIKYSTNGDDIEINIDDFKNWLPRA